MEKISFELKKIRGEQWNRTIPDLTSAMISSHAPIL